MYEVFLYKSLDDATGLHLATAYLHFNAMYNSDKKDGQTIESTLRN